MTTFEQFFKALDMMQFELDGDDALVIRAFDAVDSLKASDKTTERFGKLIDNIRNATIEAAVAISSAVAVNELDHEQTMAVLCGDAEIDVDHDDVVGIAETILLPIVGAMIHETSNANG